MNATSFNCAFYKLVIVHTWEPGLVVKTSNMCIYTNLFSANLIETTLKGALI